MEQAKAVEAQSKLVTREAFLARFTRVSPGLDPEQVYALFQKVMERVGQVEEQARRASAPFVLEATLREATDICVRATEASERAHTEIVAAAQREGERHTAEVRAWADDVIKLAEQDSERIIGDARRAAEAILADAHAMADQVRAEAFELVREAEAALEQARRLTEEDDPGAVPPLMPDPIPFAARRAASVPPATLPPEPPEAPRRPAGEPDKVMGRFTLPSWLDL
jgi:cell division septum initiation protein DivIVA